jgi:hypothetical protein
MGLPLRIGKMKPCYQDDRRDVVVQVSVDGSLRITENAEPVGLTELGDKLDMIFRTRAIRVAFVTADSHVPFGGVVRVIDAATKHVDHIAFLPRSRVLDRKPFPGETDVCLDMTLAKRDENSSDRLSSIWHLNQSSSSPRTWMKRALPGNTSRAFGRSFR